MAGVIAIVFGIEAYKEPGTLAAALMQIGGDAAFKLIFGCQIASAGICVAVVVIATLACGFLAARYGDRFWEGLVNLLFWRWWL